MLFQRVYLAANGCVAINCRSSNHWDMDFGGVSVATGLYQEPSSTIEFQVARTCEIPLLNARELVVPPVTGI